MQDLRPTVGASGYVKSTLVSGGDLVPSVGVDVIKQPGDYATAQVTVGTSQAQLTATSTPVITTPIVKAQGDNTGIVYVIKQGAAITTGIPISAGEAVTVPVDNLNKIYLIASASGQKVGAIAGIAT